MNTDPLEHLIVDIKDIECMICYSRYANPTNEAMILSCGHTVCSSCLENLQDCPFCKTEILQKPTKNMLISSLLERDSQENRCALHKRPIELYCKEEKKLLCSQCLVEKFQYRFEPIKKIESKMEEIKTAEKKINEKKQENKRDIFEKVRLASEHLKRNIDQLYEEKLAYDLSSKKKLKKLIDIFMVTEKDLYEHQLLSQGLSKYEESAKALQEKWKENPDGNTADQILDTSITTKQAIKFYNDKANQIITSFRSQEKDIKEILLQESKKCPLEKFQSLFDKVTEKLKEVLPNIKFDRENSPEISRNYLLSTFEDHGILVSYQRKEDCLELAENSSRTILNRFYPLIFDCSIEKLNLSCFSFSDSKFQVLCEILASVKGLSELRLFLESITTKKIELVSNLILKAKTLQKFSCQMPLLEDLIDSQTSYINNLFKSSRISSFALTCSPETLFVDFQQEDLLRPSAQISETLQKLTARFIGNSPLFDDILQTLKLSMINLISLKTLTLSFGCSADCHEEFLQTIFKALQQARNLRELNLGFAQLGFSEYSDIESKISQVLLNSAQLAQVSLFLVGNELSDEGFFDGLFYQEKKNVKTEHKLEEFSLTIMRCGDVAIEKIVEYLEIFPQLKRLTLRINRVDISFMHITGFLQKVTSLKLVSLDLAVRDFGELTLEEKKDLEVHKYRLSQNKIQHKIIFEELLSHHLPEYVDLVSEDEGEEEDNEEQGE